MFGVFAACALLPVIGFSSYAYRSVGDQLEADALADLRADTKSAGMSLFERLLIARTRLGGPPGVGSSQPMFLSRSEASISDLDLDASEARRLGASGAALLRVRRDGPVPAIELLVSVGDRIRTGVVDPAFLFVPERRAQKERYWVEDHAGRLLFAAAEDDRTAALLALREDAGEREIFDLEAPDGREIGTDWPLFLRVPFGAPDLRIGMSRSVDRIRRPLADFRAAFLLMTALAVAGAIAVALHEIRRTLVPLDALNLAAVGLSEGHLDTRAVVDTRDEFSDLADAFNRMAGQIEAHVDALERLHEIGIALSSERDSERVMERILSAASQLLAADLVMIYTLPQEDGDAGSLRLEGARFGSQQPEGLASAANDVAACFPVELAGRAVESRTPLYRASGDPAPACRRGAWANFERALGRRAGALLVQPMRGRSGEAAGVLAVVRAADREEGGFDTELRRTAESLASLAATSLGQARLVENLRDLFEGVVQLTVRAIDEKSPYTGSHCRNVPILTDLIADAVAEDREGPFKDLCLDEAERYELRIAALLHDCGKVVTPVHVMDKATKLEGIVDRIEFVCLRAEILRRDLELAELRRQLHERGAQQHGPSGASESALQQIEADLEFVESCNIGGESMTDAARDRIHEIQTRYRWADRRGREQPLLLADEAENLSIGRGTLNAEEREIINQHVVTTIRLLEELPFPRDMRNVPKIAGAHHERIDGSGYPHGIGGLELSLQGRILGMADVFEALTARDRPYKPGMPLSQTLSILESMVAEGHLDADLHAVFLREKVHLRYAAQYMSADQVDDGFRDEIERLTAPWSSAEASG